MSRFKMFNLAVLALVMAFSAIGIVQPGSAEAAVTVTGPSAVANGTAALTLVWPAHQTGDVAIIAVETANQAVTTPTGCTILATGTGFGTAGAAGALRLSTFWIRATSSAMPNITIADAGDHQLARMVVFRGVVASGSPVNQVSAVTQATTASPTITFPAVIPSVPNTMVVLIAADDNDGASTTHVGSWTNATLGTITEQVDNGVVDGAGGGLSIGTAPFALTTTTNTSTATLTASATQERVTVALAPDTTAPTVTIDQSSAQDPTATSPITFSVTFSETVTGFATGDVSFTGSTAGGTLLGTVSGSGASYTVTVTGMTTNGRVVASIPAGVATDVGSNLNLASTSTDNTVAWRTFTITGCTECHNHPPVDAQDGPDALTVPDRDFPAGVGAVIGSHAKHDNGGTTACDACHTTTPAANDHSDGYIDLKALYSTFEPTRVSNSKITQRSNVLTYTEAQYTAGTWFGTCTNTACHQTASPDWGSGTAVGCSSCHGQPPSSGDHTNHFALTWAPTSKITGCNSASCHVTPATNWATNHPNGTAEQTCNNAQCHNNTAILHTTLTNVTDASNPNPVWGTGTANCGWCHGNPPSMSNKAAPVSHPGNADCSLCHPQVAANDISFADNSSHMNGTVERPILSCTSCHTNQSNAAHNAHLNNNAYVNNNCDLCHGTGATTGDHTGHQTGGSTTFAGSISIYNDVAGTCTNTCHLSSTGSDWSSTGVLGTLACAECHDGGLSLDQGLFPPQTAKHTKHIDAHVAYVPTDCDSCHGSTATTGGHAGHQDGLKTSVVSYVAGTQTCTNTCHIASTTGDWTSGAVLACLDCHTATYIAAVKGAMPVSGVHNPASAGVQKHNQTLGTNGCTECHLSTALAPPTHVDNDFIANSGSNTPTERFVSRTNMTWTDGAGNTGTCYGTGLPAGTCHTDGGVWRRLWSTAADSTLTAVGSARCDVCHGQLNNWRVGVVDHNKTNINNGMHTNCDVCHVFSGAPYAWATNHQNSVIEYNSNAGYNSTTANCSVACHGDLASHTMAVSTTFVNTAGLGGTSATCTTCHAYPPDPADGKTGTYFNYTPVAESKGAHVAHTNNIVTREGVAALNAATDRFGDAKTTAVCGACHNMADVHSNGTRAVYVNNNYRNTPTGGTNPTYDGTVGVGSASDPKTCSTTACHFVASPVWAQPQ